MAPTLAELPTELLHIICASLCYHCQSQPRPGSRCLSMWDHREQLQREHAPGLRALRSLCLASKRLCGVAQPLLYHHLSPFYWDWRRRSKPLLLPFLQTISRVPGLADSTRELDVRYLIPAETRDYRLPSLLHRLLATLAPSLIADKESSLLDVDTAESNLENLLVQVLLCSTPKLETACLGVLPGWEFPLLAAAAPIGKAQHADGELHSTLSSLRTLSLTGPAVNSSNWTAGAFDGADTLLASAPNLTSLRLQELTYCPPSRLLRNVRRLELRHVLVSGAGLKNMLRECAQLEEFRYTGAPFDAGVTEKGPFGIEMVEALAPARDTLRCLEISYASPLLAPCIKNTHPDIASLKGFTKLERINLSTGFGAGASQPALTSQLSTSTGSSPHRFFLTFGRQSFADILPGSVRVFCPPCWPETILALAGARRGQCELPNLERVELEHGLSGFDAWLTRSSAWKRKRASLQDAFVDSGVDINFAEDRQASAGFSQWHTEDGI